MLAAFVAVAHTAAMGRMAFLGAAGCDVSDTRCIPAAAVNQVVGVDVAGNMQITKSTILGDHPGWVHAEGDVLYVAIAGEDAVAAYTIHPSGALSPLGGKQKTGGIAPVHLSVSPCKKWIYAANYGGCDNCTSPDGSLSVLRIAKDGSVGGVVANVPHHGHSIDPARQNSAHVHSVVPSPKYPVIYVQDLGLDTITTYRVAEDGDVSVVQVTKSSKPGAGPRHLAVHPTLDLVYVVEEMANELAVFNVSKDGALTLHKVYPSSDPNVPQGKAAEVAVTPNGKFVYITNRGDDEGSNSIKGFAIGANGDLCPVQLTATHRYPRGMAIADDETLFVAGQGDGTLTKYAILPDGKLDSLSVIHGLPTPATIAFA